MVPATEYQTTLLFRSPYLSLYCVVIKKLFLAFLGNFDLKSMNGMLSLGFAALHTLTKNRMKMIALQKKKETDMH